MAGPSIVDFVRDSLSRTAEALPGPGGKVAAALGNMDTAAFLSALSAMRPGIAPAAPLSELAYVTCAGPLLAAFQSAGNMTARQAFDATPLRDFPTCQLALKEMTRRGLLRITGQDAKYSDDIYGLADSPPA